VVRIDDAVADLELNVWKRLECLEIIQVLFR